VDCDASGSGFVVVLHQQDRSIAVYSRAIATQHVKLAAYERELIGLVQTVHHLHPYLWGLSFIIRTNHYSLKFLLDQHLSTIPQYTWVSKLFGCDFQVVFQPGKHNMAADALSRRDQETVTMHAISMTTFQMFETISEEAQHLSEVQEKREQIQKGVTAEGWSLADDFITYQGKKFMPASS
jgi:hypothetical protein